MKRTIYIAVVGLILILIFNYAYAQERITLSTYYPAPYGEYRKLAIGSSAGGYTAPTSAEIDLVVEGNVGIGTTDPRHQVEIKKSGIAINNSGGRTYNLMLTDDSSTAQGAGGAITFAGRYFTDDSTTEFAGIRGFRYDAGASDYDGGLAFFVREHLADGLTERMRIDKEGNVGIGTTSPQAEAAPNGQATGNLDVNDVWLRGANAGAGRWASEGGGLNTYVSPWFNISTSNTYSKSHGLGAVPTLVFLYIAENSDGSGRRASGNGSNDHGVDGSGSASYHSRGTTICYIDASTIKIRTGISGICFVRDENGNWWGPSSGYARIIAINLE